MNKVVPTDIAMLSDAKQSGSGFVQIDNFKRNIVGPSTTNSHGLHAT